MNPIIKKKWLNALRSGKFVQAKGNLEDNGGYCCLGVLCKITGNAHNRDMSHSYPKHSIDGITLDFMGISASTIEELAHMNDNGESFNEIADWIGVNL